MATGAASIASRARLPALSVLMLAIACAALAGVAWARRARRRSSSPSHRFWDLLTLVAATGVVGLRFRDAGLSDIGIVLAAASLVSALVAAGAGVRLLGTGGARDRPGSPCGGWLLIVVAIQSAVLSAAAVDRVTSTGWLGTAAGVGWCAGIAVYLALVIPIARAFVQAAARRAFRADSWILMGALAISTLAAVTLASTPAVLFPRALGRAASVTLVTAAAWVPILAAGDVAARRRACTPISPTRWSMVFPLAMLSLAAQAYARHERSPDIQHAGVAMMWVALVAWAVVGVGRAAGTRRYPS